MILYSSWKWFSKTIIFTKHYCIYKMSYAGRQDVIQDSQYRKNSQYGITSENYICLLLVAKYFSINNTKYWICWIYKTNLTYSFEEYKQYQYEKISKSLPSMKGKPFSLSRSNSFFLFQKYCKSDLVGITFFRYIVYCYSLDMSSVLWQRKILEL